MVLPNQLTVLRIILTPIFFILLLSEDTFLKQMALGVFLGAAITDWYDGWLARKFNYITNWGRVWDPLADKILTSAAFIALVILGLVELWMVIVIILRDFIITGLRIFSDYRNIPFPTSIYAKWKTFIQMIFLYYLLFVYVGSLTTQIYIGKEKIFEILLNQKLIFFGMLFITLLTLHSGLTYLFRNRQLIKKLFSNEN
ncbi:MAG: CDP-diacylglycerol--glycerol-3-phosphate 3-phosphatidyltransferase [Ignavibacteria bacterium RIFOXYB2_FULL_35_12]|nr:MAG: CDP-diacylglycerol--glycerol-3-phosphate 3-phosphatidyltransferase [Ignavibacteria bacterium GWA2_36_19]OGU52518.1 MAG: CDP-diacylglycerol--glycerol-3-phosphate 3-phosphatidyltransferase [Ignavibacteria bacterium GWC2_35_8]OGU56593.1 MAG: CDP-diacylglycerol--glycerol-3-phosphate 3-phosphatidyltransferase [Ignavibacteria bacterium GWF2_35_20]OGU81369.1 MAG: CDP-diacylglycerol--glycerol-3-phosphate 3-phosphatidyltransferase [Ignavibacteria bacterium RIFOXYA2_FULL_35_9]OGU87733.1 MAG: CDP-